MKEQRKGLKYHNKINKKITRKKARKTCELHKKEIPKCCDCG